MNQQGKNQIPEEWMNQLIIASNVMPRNPSQHRVVMRGSRQEMHRTIQQNVTRLCIAWIEEMAQTTHTDGRNVHSAELCEKIMANLDEEDLLLPYV